MIEGTFVEVNEKYHTGAALDEYNDTISICSAYVGKDGNNYMRWAFPQVADRQPAEKALPVSIRLGDKKQAIEILKGFIAVLSNEKEEIKSNEAQEDVPF